MRNSKIYTVLSCCEKNHNYKSLNGKIIFSVAFSSEKQITRLVVDINIVFRSWNSALPEM